MTEWEIFAQARALHDAGDCDGALTLISKARPELERIRGHVACLQASCHERKGNRALALRLLENEIAAGTTNFWVYYQIGGLYEAIAASYNGGEDNAARWLARSKPKDPGVFTAEVGFAESKAYVAKVMNNYRAYRDLYSEDLQKR